MSTALVLAGGGVTGIAWETGVLLGLSERGALPPYDAVIGTSAGSAVGAQLTSGTDLQDLYDAQCSDSHGELSPDLDLDALIAFFTSVGDISGGLPPEVVRQAGAFAKETKTVPLATRRAVIEWRLPDHAWPDTDLRITAADADTGELVVLTRDSGVSLVDAVMASCAVPGVWPPVPLLGRTLIDGGIVSPTHIPLAAGFDEVLVLVPMACPVLSVVEREVGQLDAKVTVIAADEETVEAMGPNALDPAKRRVSAEAGRRQGRASAPLA